MAPRMKHWLGLALTGCGLITVCNLPPSAQAPRERHDPLPQEIRATELRREARRTQEVIQRLRWADSLPALAVATAEAGLAVGGAADVIGADHLATLRLRLRRELAELPDRRADVVIGYFVQPSRFAAEPGFLRHGRATSETYLGVHDGTPYCLRVYTSPSPVDLREQEFRVWRAPDGKPHTNLLQTCRHVARYGLPGPEIQAWLERGASRFAASTSEPSRALMKRNPQVLRYAVVSRSTAGENASLAVSRCRSGTMEACAEVALDPADHHSDLLDVQYAIDRSPALAIEPRPSPPPAFGRAAEYLLGDLERAFGPERFGRFWSSPRVVPAAFEDAFGTSIGAWTASWVNENMGPIRAGPSLPRSAGTGTVLTLLLAALMGAAWGLRRRVA